ncbi:MAG: ribosome biogenesis GTPase YlqF [Christensenellaceae bacterium]|nr:ribosome biogenesis GTPase YlqF [Christensenellaceae bacterium]
MKIQWYPGHMAKSKRLLVDQLKKADFVIELCDARIPHSSRNPDLIELTSNKKRVLVLTKSDLADPAVTKEWLAHYKSVGETVCAYDANPRYMKKMMQFVKDASQEYIDRAENRGIKKIVRAMVIGVPNVGKSTFINRMCGSAITAVADKPGVTRSNRWVKVDPYLDLLDTPGMLWPRLDDVNAAQKIAYIGTIKDAVYDVHQLSINLIKDLLILKPQNTIDRFKLKTTEFNNDIEVLEAVCKGRGFLMKGGVFDFDRASAVVLDEFRAGKVGRISLERPSEFDNE